MAKKSKEQNKKVRVKKSYYTFSKEYPRSSIQRSEAKEDKKSSHRFIKIIICAAAAFCFISAGFFVVSVVKEIFNAPAADSVGESDSAENGISIGSDDLRAFTLPRDKVGDRAFIRKFIRQMRRKDANAVIVDFKSEDGSLLFFSSQFLAASNAYYDNGTILRMIQLFKSKDIAVIASFSCFEDSYAAETDPNMAVKYLDTDVNWSDGEKLWLNPYSKETKNYLFSLIEEISAFNVDGFILKSACFPSEGDIENASYPGEKSKGNRNEVLKKFVSKVSEKSQKPVAIEISAKTVLNDELDPYCGSFSNVCKNVVFDVSDRPEGYYVDKDSEYSSMFSLFGSLIHIEECESIIKLPKDESTNHFLKTMKTAGYKAVIVAE